MSMDAEHAVEAFAHFGADLLEAGRDGPAVRVAQAQHVGAGFLRGFERAQGEIGLVRVAVEEMLRVIDHFLAVCFEIGDSIGNELEVFLFGNPQGAPGMQLPALAENRHDRRARVEQLADVAIFLHRVFGEACRAERGQLGMLELQLGGALEKVLILGIRPRPAAFNVIDPQIVQLLGDHEFVIHGKRDGLALRAVSEGRIEGEDFHKGSRRDVGCRGVAASLRARHTRNLKSEIRLIPPQPPAARRPPSSF